MPKQRQPYFLYGALAVPALWATYFAFAFLMGVFFGSPSSGDLGNWGRAMVILLCLMVASDLIGLVCSIASVVRRERYRGLSFTCLTIYAIPLFLYGALFVLQLGASGGQRVMNEMPAKVNSSQNSP